MMLKFMVLVYCVLLVGVVSGVFITGNGLGTHRRGRILNLNIGKLRSVKKSRSYNEPVGINCTIESTFPKEDLAKILLLNNAKDVSNVLKENPFDRDEKLMKLLHKHFAGNEDLFADIFSVQRELLRTNDFHNSARSEDEAIDLKIKRLLDLHGEGVEEKLNGLALYLSDFLSLKAESKFREEFQLEADDLQGEIKRLLYMNPEGIDDDLVRSFGNGNFSGNVDGIQEYIRRKLFGCTKSVNANNKTVLAVKTNGDKRGEEEGAVSNEVSKKFDESTSNEEVEVEDEDDEERTSANRGLQFLDVPDGDNMRIHTLKIDNENMIFSTFSTMVSYLQPDEFPLGLLRDAFRQHVQPHIIVLQILKLEGLVLCWVLFWAILALCLPCAVLAQMCCPRTNIHRLRDDASSASSNLNGKCTGKTSGFVLYILMLSLLSSILLMLVANDKLSRAIERSPNTASIIFKDLETFIKNTQLQTSFVATSSFEITTDQINKDLQDVEKLLGESFRKDFISETGFDETLAGLITLKSGSAEISKRVRELLRECNVAKGAAKLLQEGLSELSRQVNLARRYCTQKDRSLCESLQSTGLEVAFTVEELLTDATLQYLDRITHDNKFNASIDQTAKTLSSFSKHVEIETSSLRAAILDALQLRRRQMYASVRSLEDISKSMTLSVKATGREVSELAEDVAVGDLWRYLAVLAVSFLTFFAWILYLCGSPCCCHYTKKTIFYLKLGIFITCILSIALWLCGSLTFLLGGHGQTIICYPLYEDNFIILSNILDKDGLIYEEGYFTHVLKANESLKTEEILRNCQRNQASFTTFHLENRIDLSKIFNYQSWDNVQSLFDEFSFPTASLKIFSNNLENHLENYSSAASKHKFRDIRSKISFPVTHKDLATFYDQIYSVTKQISNTKSAITFEKVMIKTQEIISNELRVVENHKDSILYKLTALEILLQPVHLKIQNYLNRLLEAQVFLEDHGTILAEKNAKRYIFRLERHLHDLQKHVNEQIRRKIGRCRPLWDIFLHLREHICKAMVDPMNALSFSYFISILIFLCLTPIVINLIAYYKEVNVHFPESLSNGHFDQELSMRDQAIWTSPQPGLVYNSKSTASGNHSLPSLPPLPNNETRWTSPTLSPGPPPPPRPPSITSIKAAPRLAGLYTIAKAKSIKSKYDPLKFIERTWKTPRSVQSPRGWL